MAKKTYTRFNINKEEDMQPRMDKPYHFESTKQKSMPWDAQDDGAAYSKSFKKTQEQEAER